MPEEAINADAQKEAIVILRELCAALFDICQDQYHPSDLRIQKAAQAMRQLDEILKI